MREHGEGCWPGHPPTGNAEPRGPAPDGRPGGEPPALAPKSSPPAPQ
jgi:hypothetical protein